MPIGPNGKELDSPYAKSQVWVLWMEKIDVGRALSPYMGPPFWLRLNRGVHPAWLGLKWGYIYKKETNRLLIDVYVGMIHLFILYNKYTGWGE